MNNDSFIHQDIHPGIPQTPPPCQTPMVRPSYPPPQVSPIYKTPLPQEDKPFREALRRRTILTSIVCILGTFAVTVSLLVFAFYAFHISATNTGNTNTLVFDTATETQKAVGKLKIMIQAIKDNYLEELTDAQILDAMTNGFPSGLNNPYTYYMSAENFASNQEAMSGKYVGVGCTVTLTKDVGVEIVEVIQGSPAEKAGLLRGDIFISVDGEDINMTATSTDVAAKVKGLEGTTVSLEIYRPSTRETLEFSIVRSTIQSQNVKYRMLDATTGYLMVKNFAEGVPADFIAAMDNLQKQGATNMVFDLRNNSGGNAQVMIKMLEYLLPPDTLLATIKGREAGKAFEIKWIATGGVKVPDTMRYAILTNEFTASASEFFSGCLRDYGKAVLVGKNTYGKGSGTKLYELPDGSAVNITMFQYYLPDGESIEKVGLKPDIEIDVAAEDQSLSIESLTLDQDKPLQKAIEVLHP